MQDLREHGYQVTSVDKYSSRGVWTKIVDCEDMGQLVSLMREHDAVVHLAAIPSPNSHPAEIVFRNNVISAYNVLEAATILGIRKVVMASSISALGTAFAIRHFNPLVVPIDEGHALLSQDAYGLSKMVGEMVADGFVRRVPDLSLVSLRFGLVVDEATRNDFLRPTSQRANLNDALASIFWTYTEVRDVASSCRLALESGLVGHEAFFINAPQILVDTPIEELLAQYYPGDYPVAAHIRGSACPVECGKAERLLGWKANYHWEGHEL